MAQILAPAMKKTGMPWFRSSHNAWYVWHQGRQVPLAKGRDNKAEAMAQFAALLGAGPTEPAPQTLTVAALVAAYQEDIRSRIKPSTFVSYDCILKPFAATFGTVEVAGLEVSEVEGWAAKRKWSQTTRRYALTVVNGVMKWALRTKRLTANPLSDLRRPAGRSRGADILIDADLHNRILAVVSQEFGQFLTAVRGTGARPGEVARVEARHCVWESACWILPDHKTAAKVGRDRIIHLPNDVLTLCKELAALRPTGFLFRTTRGEQWRKESWKQAMMRAEKKLGLKKRPMTSGYRHSLATEALEAGVPAAVVGELLGHQGPAMVSKHYGHLGERRKVMAEALRKVR